MLLTLDGVHLWLQVGEVEVELGFEQGGVEAEDMLTATSQLEEQVLQQGVPATVSD